jgi:hypothetical protein
MDVHDIVDRFGVSELIQLLAEPRRNSANGPATRTADRTDAPDLIIASSPEFGLRQEKAAVRAPRLCRLHAAAPTRETPQLGINARSA